MQRRVHCRMPCVHALVHQGSTAALSVCALVLRHSCDVQARILDLLLGLQTHEERVDLLPDCFTPPDPASAQTGPEADNADTDELWCTPAQLLSEIDGRLRALEADSKQDVGSEGMRKQLASVDGQLVGAALRDALTELRVAVNAAMLESLARGPA